MTVSRFALSLAVAVVTVGSAHACSTAPSDPLTLACGAEECPCKARDPVEHCVRLDGCRSDGDCPAGTVCLPASRTEPPLASPLDACVPPDAAGARCRISSDPFDRALVEGFHVNEFLIEPIADTPSFRLSPPPAASLVACALFGCRPDVKRTESADVVGGAEGEIVNYDLCALSGAPQVFTLSQDSAAMGGELVFTPSVSSTPEAPDSDAGSPCAGVPDAGALPGRERQVTQLAVGCWAYDDSSLLGASRLTPVPADQILALSNIATVLAADCQSHPADTLGKSCLLGSADPPLIDPPQLGACFAGACRARCVTAADCPEAQASKDCPEPAATCTHDGPDEPDGKPSFVGACQYACDRAGATGADGGLP